MMLDCLLKTMGKGKCVRGVNRILFTHSEYVGGGRVTRVGNQVHKLDRPALTRHERRVHTKVLLLKIPEKIFQQDRQRYFLVH